MRPLARARGRNDEAVQRGVVRILLLLACLGLSHAASAQGPAPGEPFERAPVNLDGELLFHVRGAPGFPAAERAERVRERIVEVAEDPTFDPATMELREAEHGIEMWGSGRYLGTVFDADARLEGLETRILATAVMRRIERAVIDYRAARSPEGIRRAIQVVAAATLALAVVLALLLLLARGASRLIARRLEKRVEQLERKTRRIFELRHFWHALQIAVRPVFVLLGVFAFYYYVTTVLWALPWTRGLAAGAFALVTEPLLGVGLAVLRAVPDLIVLALILVVARYALKVVQTFFERVAAGRIRLADFEAGWAAPTERLIRLIIILFALIIAYPYIPGSSSDAFKGISIFAGLMLSLGSSSIIANVIAGYSMIYRRAFQVGDRVEIAGVLGDVESTRVLATYLRTIKNVRVTLPNSIVLNNQIVNYTQLAKESGLILHTVVTIGYEVPWREVEAMLLEAAQRTPHLLKRPPPFVLQKALSDFAPAYELNAYTHDDKAMAATYSALHANIQDVFAEKGVQIMTPHYVADPQVAKVPPVEAAAAPARGARARVSPESAPAAGP
jgi:small-conductance mechanosensitive channel